MTLPRHPDSPMPILEASIDLSHPKLTQDGRYTRID